MQDKLTIFCGNRLLQNDCINTFGSADERDAGGGGGRAVAGDARAHLVSHNTFTN